MLLPEQKPRLLLYEPNRLIKIIKEKEIDDFLLGPRLDNDESLFIKLNQVKENLFDKIRKNSNKNKVHFILSLNDLNDKKTKNILKSGVVESVFIELGDGDLEEIETNTALNEVKKLRIKTRPFLKIRKRDIKKIEGIIKKLKECFSTPFFIQTDKEEMVIILEKVLKSADCMNIPLLLKEKTDHFRVIGLKNNKVYVAPEAVSMDLSDRCNTNCIYCWHHSPLLEHRPPLSEKTKIINKEIFKKFVDQLSLHGMEWLELSGRGEPFTHPNIMQFIRYAKEKGLKIYMYTNGLLLNKELVEELAELGVGLRVNLSASNPETYAKIHPSASKKDFDNLISNLKYYSSLSNGRSENFIFSTENVLCKINYKEMRDIIKLSKGIGCNEVAFSIFSATPGTEKLAIEDVHGLNKEVINCEKLLKGGNLTSNLRDIKHLLHTNKNLKVFDSESFSLKAYSDFGCCFMWFYGRALINGNFYPCTEINNIYNLKNIKNMGDLKRINLLNKLTIKNKSFENIWKSRLIDYFRNKAKSGRQSDNKSTLWPICERCVHFSNNLELDFIIKNEYGIDLK